MGFSQDRSVEPKGIWTLTSASYAGCRAQHLEAGQQRGILPALFTAGQSVTAHYIQPITYASSPEGTGQGHCRKWEETPGGFLNEVAYLEILLGSSSYRAEVLMTLASLGPENSCSPWDLREGHLGCGHTVSPADCCQGE